MIFVCLFSFFLDGIITILVSEKSFLLPLFSIVSLVAIYPYMINRKKQFILYGLIIGMLYDIVYTQTLFLNTVVFIIISLTIILFYKYIPVNIVNSLLCTTLLIFIFRVLIFLILVLVGLKSFNWYAMFSSIYKSLIFNYFYLVIVYFLLWKIDKIKQRKHKILISI